MIITLIFLLITFAIFVPFTFNCTLPWEATRIIDVRFKKKPHTHNTSDIHFLQKLYLYMLGRKWLRLVINSWSFSLSLLFLIFRKDNLNKNQKTLCLFHSLTPMDSHWRVKSFFRSPHTTTRSFDGHSNIKLNDFSQSAIYISRIFY